MTDHKKEPEQPLLEKPKKTPSVTTEVDAIQAATDAPIAAISKEIRLASLREKKEVVEEDADLVDIFMFVRSDVPLTKKIFLGKFPNAKALMITQKQLWEIEDCADGNFLSYMTASGKRKYVCADDMEDDQPLVLFIEDLGDEP